MSSPSVPPPDELLLKCHFVYEINMLWEAYRRYPRHATTTDDAKILNNILIEAFCVHARNLVEFFNVIKGNTRFTDKPYQPILSTRKRRDIKQRLNNQITHLIKNGVSRRVMKDEEKIDPEEIANILNQLVAEIAAFKANLAQDYTSIAIPVPPHVDPALAKSATTPSPTTTGNIVITSIDNWAGT